MSIAETISKKFSLDFTSLDEFYDMCFVISNTYEILSSNKAAFKLLKINNSEIKGENFLNLIDNYYKEKALIFLTECSKENESRNFITKFKVGERNFDVDLFISLIKKETNGKDKSFFIIARDITEERRKELDLLRFYNIAEKTIFPLAITNIEGNLVYVNPAFQAASGYTRNEVLGKNPNIFGSGKHSKKFWTNMWETVNSGKVWVGEVENKRKNGEPYYAQLMISPIVDYNHRVTGFFGIHRDLSDKKLLEKQLVHTQKMESIGTLAAGVAHEVGNPLASISALVQVVLRTTDDLFVKEKLGLIKGQITRISKIIRDLVDFSRPSNYELKLTDINQILDESINIIKVGKKAKNIEFEINLNEKIPPLPLIPDQIEQVFLNVLLNAVDAINDKEDKYRIQKIIVESEMDEDYATIKFTDTGKGMGDEEMSKVFEPFFTTKREGIGTGLGLWISYGIIKSFEGLITVTSKEEVGSTFTIKLPFNRKI
jgi:PAS domain S-box-containing protein